LKNAFDFTWRRYLKGPDGKYLHGPAALNSARRSMAPGTGGWGGRLSLAPGTGGWGGRSDFGVVGRCRFTPASPLLDRAWFQRLKVQYDEPLQNSAFNSN